MPAKLTPGRAGDRIEVSSPSGELRRVATPPVRATTQMSPAYTNAIRSADTSG